MGSQNFQGGAVEIVIFKDGQKITKDNYPAFFRSVASVRAEVHQGETSNVTITLTPSLVDGLAILSSGIIGSQIGPGFKLPDKKMVSILSNNSIVADDTKTTTALSNATYYAVRFYYANGDSTPYYGGFTCQPHFTLGAEIEITIKITGEHNLMTLSGGPFRFENQPALDVLTSLADPFGVDITFDDDDTDTESLLSTSLITGSFNEDHEGIFRKILADLRCFYVKMHGDDINSNPQYRIKSSKYLANQNPDFTFVMYRQVAPEQGVIPIEELSLETNGILFSPGCTFGTFTKGIESSTKLVVSSAGSPSDFKGQSNSGTKSDAGAMPLDTGDAKDFNGAVGLVDAKAQIAGIHGPGLKRDDASTMDTANSRAEMARMAMLKFHARTPGLPKLRPQSSVQLLIGSGTDGLEAFCGSTFVQGLVHNWDSTGWTTESILHKSAGPIFNPGASEKASLPPPPPSNKSTVTPTPIK